MNVIRPPFTLETATAKVRAAEDAWNSRDPQRVSLAYSEDSEWRNRDRFLQGALPISVLWLRCLLIWLAIQYPHR